MARILNYTPHAVQFLNIRTHELIVSYPPEPTAIRGKHELGARVGDVAGVLVFDIGSYTCDHAEMEALGLKAGDTIFVSSIGADQIKAYALKHGIRVLIPGSGPGQCLRDASGQIKGSYFALQPF